MVSYESVGREKVALRRDVVLDLTQKTTLSLDCYNEGNPLEMSFAACTGRSYVFFEAPAKRVKGGWQRGVTFSLEEAHFKCEASNWLYTETIAQRELTLSLFLLFYGREKAGTFYIDNIRLE